MVNNLLGNLSDSKERLDEYNRQLSTGKKFDMPSQNPTGTVRSMDLESTISSNKQYTRNINQSLTWIKSTEGTLSHANDILHRTRELAVKGANGSLNETDRQSIADEVKELKANMKGVANTSYNGKYIFAGHKVNIKPYSDNSSKYQGDDGKIIREISQGTEVKINQSGDFFEPILDRMEKLIDNLETGNIDGISNNISDLDESLDEVIKKRSEVGAKQNRLELTKNRLEDDKIKFKELLSQNEDVDIAKTIMNLKMSENVHRAALSSGARIIQPSLTDFLR